MAALTDLNQLYEDLTGEIGELQRKRDIHTQDIQTKEARLEFLQDTLQLLEAKKLQLDQDYANTRQSYSERLDAVKNQLLELQKEYDYTRQKLADAEGDLIVMQQSHEKAITELGEHLRSEKVKLEETTVQRDKLLYEIKMLNIEATETRKVTDTLDEVARDKQRETAELIDSYTLDTELVMKKHKQAASELDDLQQDIEEINKQIELKQAENSAYEQSKQDFEAYKQTAIKALETREASLLERERQFEYDQATAKRRNSVL